MTLLERAPLLDALTAALREAAAGAGQVALVYGEAGIGKTALVDAFTRERAKAARLLAWALDPISSASDSACEPRVCGASRAGRDLAPDITPSA